MTPQPLSPSLDSVQSSQAHEMPAEGLYLQLLLDRGLPAMLPAPQLVEILTVAIGQIVPIFHLPPWVVGVYNWRGEVLWVADLNHLLGLTPWYEQPDYGSKHTVIVLRGLDESEQAIVGLVVNQVEEIVKCSADCFHMSLEVHSLEVHSLEVHSLAERSSSETPMSSVAASSVAASSITTSSMTGSRLNALPVHLHQFFLGYWQNEVDSHYWLLNRAAILQNLSKSFS